MEIRTRQGLHTPCVEKTLILISTGGVVLMPAFNNGICHFSIRVVLLVRWQSPVLNFMDFGVRIAPAMPVSVFCLLLSHRSRSRLFRQEERQNFSMSRFGISIGEYPKGYDAKIHGPYNPAVNYGKGTKWQRMKLYLTCC